MSARKAAPISGLCRDRLGERLLDEVAGHGAMVQPGRDAVRHGRFERAVVEHRRMDEPAQLPFAADHILGLLAQPLPHGIDAVDASGTNRL